MGNNHNHDNCSGHSHSHDDHKHDHSHGIGGHHHHAPGDNILFAFFLNAGFSIIEFIGGYYTNSVAILSDAVHDLGDSMALLMAYMLEKYSTKKPDEKFNYGYRRFSVLSAFVTSGILLVGSFFVIQKAIERILNPEPVHVQGVIGMAILGVAVNSFAAWKMSKGEGLNQRAVMLHLMEDVLGWVAVLVVGIVLLFKDWFILDPILSILIALIILKNVYTNLINIGKVVLQKFPDDLEIKTLKHEINSLSEVIEIHSIQAWSIDSVSHSLSLHVVVDSKMNVTEMDKLKKTIRKILSRYRILHSSIEFEGKDFNCEGVEFVPHKAH